MISTTNANLPTLTGDDCHSMFACWPAGPTFPTFPYFLIQSSTFSYFLRKQPCYPYFLGCHVVKLIKEHLKHVFFTLIFNIKSIFC